MRWIKKGVIYKPDGTIGWAKSHATAPTPEVLNEHTIRIYISPRDEHGVGRVGFVDVDVDDPSRISNVSEKPVLDIGAPGTFDENGVMATSVVNVGNKKYLYYVGFQLGLKIRYFLFTGLAVSYDGGISFKRHSQTPILDRSDSDLFFRCGPFVFPEHDVWKMWYVGGSQWTVVGGKSLPVYRIKYLESRDGISWERNGPSCFDFKDASEYGFGRPYVVKEDGIYKMFFSIRTLTKRYVLGYAESPDGKTWKRRDEDLGITTSNGGWDSEMICYSSVLRTRTRTYMFYNGNNFGETGFGYAILEE